jgi:hypothetical protein
VDANSAQLSSAEVDVAFD